jgi:hypothetical protein
VEVARNVSGEIFNLKRFDLDFDRGVIYVRKTRVELATRNPKTLGVIPPESQFAFTSIEPLR